MTAFARRFLLGLAATLALGGVTLTLAAREGDEPARLPYAVPAAIPPADAVMPTVVPVHVIEPPRPEAAVGLEWSGPPVVRLGQPNDYTLTVRNASSQAVQKVTVQVRAAKGATVAADAPAVTNAEGVLVWELPALDVKQSKDFKLRVTPTQAGETGCQAWVTLTGTAGMKVQVQQPKLEVTIDAPAKVTKGDAITVKVVARNSRDCPAENVSVVLHTPDGDVPITKPGTVPAGKHFGETQFRHTIQAKAAGPLAFTVVATGTDCDPATATATTTVVAPQLKVTLTGPKDLLVGQVGRYTMRVENTGQIPVTNVRYGQSLMTNWSGLAFPVSAADLAPGEWREEFSNLTPHAVGRFTQATVVVGDHVRATAECVTVVDGIPALRMELIDTADPVPKGGETVYEVRVTNTGTKADANVLVACPLPPEMTFVKADGPTGHTATALNNCTVVRFDAVRELAPKHEAVFRVTVRATATGDVRFKATLNSQALSTSVTKEESTRVYGD